MSYTPLFIFDAGSTKTDLLIYNNGKITTHLLSGYNPNRSDGTFLNELKAISIPLNSEIHFYGSGLGKNIGENELTRFFTLHHVYFNNDMIGAARALLSNSPGIISIMGTGGVVGHYDGQQITCQKGGYGYLIDDYGGGLELAKIIISGWLNNYYNTATCLAIKSHFHSTTDTFIADFYQTKSLHHITSVCKILPHLLSKDRKLKNSVQNYFNTFFVRHISPMCEQQEIRTINLAGSIALNFFSLINETASLHDITITSCIDKPIQNLLKYHRSQKK